MSKTKSLFLLPTTLFLAFALIAAEPATARSNPESPTAEAAPSAEPVESSQRMDACLAAQGLVTMPDCAKGCQNAARVAEAAGDPPAQILSRLHACLDMCRM